MSFKAMVWAWEVDGLTTTTKMVLLALANRASEDKGHCWPSIERIAAECRMGDRAVQNAIKTLEKDGYIRIVRRVRETNQFFLQMHLEIVAERAQEMHPQDEPRVHHVPNKGASAAPEPITEPIKKITPTIPIGNQALPGLELPPNLLGRSKPAATKAEATKTQADALIETWNIICARVKKATHVNDARRALVLKRFKEEFNNDPAEWEKFCKRCARSPFLTGDNDRDWKPPSFDWMMRPDKIANVLDGVYDDKSGNQGSSAPRRFIPSPGTI